MCWGPAAACASSSEARALGLQLSDVDRRTQCLAASVGVVLWNDSVVPCCRRYDGESSSESGTSMQDVEAEDAEEAPPPPLAAPDLFDAVAEEWQRLRLAMQDVY